MRETSARRVDGVEKFRSNLFESVEGFDADDVRFEAKIKVAADAVVVDLRDSVTELVELDASAVHFTLPEASHLLQKVFALRPGYRRFVGLGKDSKIEKNVLQVVIELKNLVKLQINELTLM